MIDFLTWCKNHNFDPSHNEEETKVKSEGSQKRAGVRSHAYPELYSRGQYTKSDLRATAADAITYQDLDSKKDN